MTRRLAGVVAVVGLVCTLAACGSSADDSKALPSVALESLDGASTIELGSVRGPAVVNLWAVTCVPCRQELPALQESADEHPEVSVFLVNNGDDPGPAMDFLDEIGVSLPAYQDPLAEVSSALGVASLPATVFVSSDGSTDLHFGVLDLGELSDRLDQLG
jgi:thiol-disulfide isomerase/thioredoxin